MTDMIKLAVLTYFLLKDLCQQSSNWQYPMAFIPTCTSDYENNMTQKESKSFSDKDYLFISVQQADIRT